MKKLVVVVAALFFLVQLYAQPKGCSDSIVFNEFNPTLFQYFETGLNTIAQRDSVDNVFLGGSYGSYIGAQSYSSIIKFDKNNNIVWSKWYKPATVSSNFRNFGELVTIDNNANLFFTGGINLPSGNKELITKLDSSGTFIWSKEFTSSSNNFILEIPVINDNNLFFYNTAGEIASLSLSGNFLWAKKYGIINPPAGFINSGLKMCALPNNNLLVCITGFTSPNGMASHPNALHFVHFAKINGTTGTVIQQQTIRCFTSAGPTMLKFSPNNLSYDNISGTALLVGVVYISGAGSGSTISKQVYCKLDSNLAPLTTAYINSNAIFSSGYSNYEAYISVSKKNEVSFVFQEYKGSFSTVDKLNYITINNNLQITAQRKINYNIFGFPAAPVKTTIGFKKDGTFVEGYWRTSPNNTNRDNFSTKGNENPYNGKIGWIEPDNNNLNTYNQ